ncbi:hypothetical protein MPTK1_7g12150 [Marchantia polymorpha subsp. ruderalis]|uniref:Uncharacterized protein n=2 Tax=Marchantia polymorpha TaxID=3197 RepID=A0AAF6BYN6_MARPO|nr:hypothetical protein MARPO_0003s0228 [Marchantia polymorpha]BBN17120.1 hypothetical protein Mp_7g12150 [Marchantia polymorpha subsp. ruderalis]|eukprot:PTQ49359.1 hypothetical protein MARPO_0003s0228 [Marchantia polymorpha]
MTKSTRIFAAMVLLLLQIGTRVSAVSQQIINNGGSSCSSQSIGNGFGQSFTTGLSVVATIDTIDIYLEPHPTTVTSYQIKIYVPASSGCSTTAIGTSFITNIPAQNQGGLAGWYPFRLVDKNAAPLYPGTSYLIYVTHTSTNFGNYKLCGNTYANGNAFTSTCAQSTGNDIAFRVTIIRAPRLEPGNTVALRTRLPANTYVSANNYASPFHTNSLAANRAAVGQYESFSVENAGSGKIYLKCNGNNGGGQKYCRFDSSLNNELLCDQTTPGVTSQFTEVDVGNAASGLIASNGLFVRTDAGSSYKLKADQSSVGGPAEAFSCDIVP